MGTPRACGSARTSSSTSSGPSSPAASSAPDRAELLASTHGDEPVSDDGTAARAAAISGKIKELERQQANVVKELCEYRATGDDDLDQEWRGQLHASFAEITNATEAPAPADPRLLDQLPILDTDLGKAPRRS